MRWTATIGATDARPRVAVGVGRRGHADLRRSPSARVRAAQQAARSAPAPARAVALAYKVNPIFGNLSFGITAGESVAGPPEHRGHAPRARPSTSASSASPSPARAATATTPRSPAEQQPQPVIVRVRRPGRRRGQDRPPSAAPSPCSPGPPRSPSPRRSPRSPRSAIPTRVVDLRRHDAPPPPASSRRVSARPGPSPRSAEVSLLGGLVTLQGLRWEAVQRTGGTTTNTGILHPRLDQRRRHGHPAARATRWPSWPPSRTSSAALGFTITPPATRVEQGIVFVDPLRIGIIPSAAPRRPRRPDPRRRPADVREQLTALLASSAATATCDVLGNNAKTAVTVLDLAARHGQRRRRAHPRARRRAGHHGRASPASRASAPCRPLPALPRPRPAR